MQVAYNYEENNKKVLVIKSVIDTKGEEYLESRIGLKRRVDVLLKLDDSIRDINIEGISCILVDEAQFLTEKQVADLWEITKEFDVPVICYGIRTDFTGNLFPGSLKLFALADELEELITICSCGKRAKFNARFVDGTFVKDGDSVLIDGSNTKVSYKPMCGKCFLKNLKQ